MLTTYPRASLRHPASQSGRGVWFVDAVGQNVARTHCCGSPMPIVSRLVNGHGHTDIECVGCGKSHELRLEGWSGVGGPEDQA